MTSHDAQHAIDNIAPFWLSVSAVSGCVTVLLPRSFHGRIALKFMGQERGVSDEILKNSTWQLTTMPHTRMFFVGDYSAVPGFGFDSATEWAGDQLNVDVERHGWVRVQYVDEPEPEPEPEPLGRPEAWVFQSVVLQLNKFKIVSEDHERFDH